MLGIHRITANRAEYYLSDLAWEVPVPQTLDVGRAVWLGRGSAPLGLHGPVGPQHLHSVLAGQHPSTGRQMRSERATVHGYDLTFSAPKSVSVLFALGGDEVARQIVAVHQEAARGALTYLEEHALSAQRGSGESRRVIPTTGAVAAAFVHGVNRNMDPHLHTHVVLANLVHGVDSRWSAVDQRGLLAHRPAASALYEAQLRNDLSARLGVRWEPIRAGRAEMQGISPLVLGEFSSRSADIRRHMASWGSHSARGSHVAWAVTRPQKGPSQQFGEISNEWSRRATALTGERSDLVAALGLPHPVRSAGALDEHTFGAVLSGAPDGAARRRDVVTALGTAAIGGASMPTVQQLTDLWVPSAPAEEIGVAERAHQLRTVVPPGYLLRALGPRPVDSSEHRVWREAAHAIDEYRHQWGITTTKEALGLDQLPSGISSLGTDQLVDHLRAAGHMEMARQRLGWREPHALGMDRGR
jgi:conjugative relaxase-like TrwC/TraI family protein